MLLQAVKGISEVITQPGEVKIDFNDIRKVMCHSHKSLIGIGEASGPGRHLAAVKKAISSPLLENADIRGAKGFIVHFSAEENLTLLEQGEVMNLIRQYASNDSIIMFGYTYDSSLAGAFKVTVIATGFSPEKANVFRGRMPLPKGDTTSVSKPTIGDIFSSFEKERAVEPEDEMLIPAFLRRKKNRS